MDTLVLALGLGLVVAGISSVVFAVVRSHSSSGALAYLVDADSATSAAVTDPSQSLAERVFAPLARKMTDRVRQLYPTRHLDRLHRQLLHAGLSASIRAEEFVTIQLALAGLAVVGDIALLAAGGGTLRLRVILALAIAFSALMAPPAWLARRVRERTVKLERELPDVLDLLTIAVESGLGLEQAMEAAVSNFESVMADEIVRTLQEMSLGLSRQEAFDNLKQRSESTDLASFVVVLTQADVLGMPIGRVLRTQADEMRDRRRARARERAAKLPVKILFPLMLCIFPPLMIIVVGPAAASIARAFHL